jgi:hypothetical protein
VKIRIRVQPNARATGIEQLPDGTLKVKVAAPAQDGKANQAVTEALALHFQVPKRQVRIVSGVSSRIKTVEIE